MRSNLAALLMPFVLLAPLTEAHRTSPIRVSATCIGADPCHACQNCSERRNCNDLGGTCGICHWPLRTISGHITLPGIVNAAQVSLLGLPPGSYVVATTNPNHFAALGIEAKEWLIILP
jgi:hypothetical protein